RAAVPARSASARAGGRPRWRPAPFLQFGRPWRPSGGCFCQSWRIASFVHTVCPGGPDYIRTGGVLMETKGWKSFWTALWVSLLVLLPLVAGTAVLAQRQAAGRVRASESQSGVPVQLPREENH